MTTSPHLLELRDLSERAERELGWYALAQFIDELNEQYQHFNWAISQRTIGPHVPRSRRPKSLEAKARG